MTQFTETVKEASELVKRSAEVLKETKPDISEARFDLADKLNEVIEELIRLSSLTSALPPELGNVHDLPSDLLKELSIANTDELEDQIVTVINSYGGEASLDQILVGLFRKFKVVQKRRFLMNKLYRMVMVWSVAGKKGVYTLTEPEDVEDEEPSIDIDAIFNNDIDDEVPF